MAITTIEVPYRDDYNLGVGADLATGSPMGLVVEGTPEGVASAAGATVTFEVRRVTSTEELQQTLGIDAEASYGSGLFGAGISARFGFSKKCAVQTSSLFLTVSSQVNLQHLSIRAPRLTAAAATLVDNPDVFVQRYGNMFVRGLDRGGLFLGVFRFDVQSQQDQMAISAALEGSYGLFSASVAAQFDQVRKTYRADALVSMYHEGGPIDLTITDPTQPQQLLDNANRWLQSFASDPARNAVPFSVTLAPVAIAEGPLPPNTAQLEHAQDVVVLCAKQRNQILDRLNLLEFVVNHSEAYEWTGDPTLTVDSLNAAISGFEQDLDLVAACASIAINHPSQALTPAGLAQSKQQPYPVGIAPAVMPPPKPRELIEASILVPDLLGIDGYQYVSFQWVLGQGTPEQIVAGVMVNDRPRPVAIALETVRFLNLSADGQIVLRSVPDDIYFALGPTTRLVSSNQSPLPGTMIRPGTEVVIEFTEYPT